MYKHSANNQIEPSEFYLPFKGKLNPNNRWVKLANIMPWDFIEEIYTENLSTRKQVVPALTGRIAFGSLVIQAMEKLTDSDVVKKITEVPYVQYFLGYTKFHLESPFDSSMLVHFRKRFNANTIKLIKKRIMSTTKKKQLIDEDVGGAKGDQKNIKKNN